MAYDTYELSQYNGAPVELFLFSDDVSQKVWAFTTGEDALLDGLTLYVPDIISRSSVKAGGSEIAGAIQVKVPLTSTIAEQFKAYLPTRPIGLTVQRYHRTDTAVQRVTVFSGQVTTAAFENDGMTALNCEPVTKAVKRKVPWQVYKAGCNHALYELGCGVSRELFATGAGAYTLSGTTLTSLEFGAKPDGWFNNGYVEAPATGERRYIIGHVGNVITIDYPFIGLSAGQALTAYAGCDRQRATCRDKFNNLQNMLAFDWIPSDNPFDKNFGPSGSGTSGGSSGTGSVTGKLAVVLVQRAADRG